MVDVLALARVITMSVSHPYSVGRYKVVVGNVNLFRYLNCSDSCVLMYVSVKDYSFRGSSIRTFAHTLVRSYERPFQHNLECSSVLNP